MDEKLSGVRANSTYQQKSIDALLSITKPGVGVLTTEQLFKKAIRIIQDITGFETITARLYDPERKHFKIMAQIGMTPEMVEHLKIVSDDVPVFSEIMKNKMPAVKIPLQLVRDQGYKKTIFIPLVAGDIIIGSIDLPNKNDYEPTVDEFHWFALVGRILGSLIYQTQLTTRLQSMAVIQERTRLANEMHDEFAQCVRSMKWGLEDLRMTLENNQPEKAIGMLKNLEILAQNTSAYLREEMLGLREKVDPNRGIIPTLEGMLLRFEANWGIKTELLAMGNVATNHINFISSEAENQLIRIIQESLSNIHRHANATVVSLSISDDADRIVFTLEDNGIGFRMEDVPQESLGLRVIKERASSVGATVWIDSIEGKGTTVKIEFLNQAGGLP